MLNFSNFEFDPDKFFTNCPFQDPRYGSLGNCIFNSIFVKTSFLTLVDGFMLKFLNFEFDPDKIFMNSPFQDPGSVSMENSAMDLLKFTPEELVCLLKNFDTLSQEERKEWRNINILQSFLQGCIFS